jgi:GT2 family glycosyltransferase
MKPYRDYVHTKDGDKAIQERPAPGSVGIVVPVRNGLKFFKLCFHSILSFTDHPYLLAIVDNMSDLDTRKYFLHTHHNHQIYWLRYDEDFNYAAEANLGLKKLFSFPEVEYGLVMNADVVVTPHWLTNMVEVMMSNPKIGAVGPLSNMAIPEQMDVEKRGVVGPAQRLSGMCMLIRRKAWEEANGFDEDFEGGGFEDWDFCERIRRMGWFVIIDGTTYVHHFFKKFRRNDHDADMKRNEDLFFKKHPLVLDLVKRGDLAKKQEEALAL